MSSPAVTPFQSFVKLDKQLKTPIYLQLTQQLINAIQRGYLSTNAKLPGSRSMGDIFNLHRKTVIAAYDELAAQGWIEIIPNKGAVVLPSNKRQLKKQAYSHLVALSGYPENTGYSFSSSNLLDKISEESDCLLQLNDGQPDYRLAQLSYLSSLYSATMKRKSTVQKLTKSNTSAHFKKQLSNYLNQSRGLHIGSHDICITKSSEMSLYLIARILLKESDIVAVAHPGYYAANMTFQNAGANLLTISIDEDGIVVDELKEKLKTTTIRMLYLTPHHHYPTTVNLSAQRRVQILQLAEKYGFVIVEDDDDYDFHFEKNNILPLASADVSGMVVYLGTFGKSLAPAFSCGFVVAPKNLIVEIDKYASLLSRYNDVIMEQVLVEMISEGEMHRHLRKALKVYEERRNNCCELITKNLGNDVSFEKPKSGLAVWVNFQQKISLVKLAHFCEKQELHIPKNLLYQDKKTTAIRLGFGHLNFEEMEQVVKILTTNFRAIQTH